MTKPKILFIVIDGLGDRQIPELDNKTPLEAAKTPNMDFFASRGLTGLIKPIYKGSFPSSNDAHLSLFGYSLNKNYIGRGVFEAVASGIKLKKGDVAFRVNFASVDDNLIILDRRAGRIKYKEPLVKAIQGIKIKNIKFILGNALEHRASLVLRGKNLSEMVSDGDPQKTGVKPLEIKPLKNSKEANFTAKVLNEYLFLTHKILMSHPFNQKRLKNNLLPANYLLIRNPGILKKIENFNKKWNLKSCFIAGGFLYKGIAKTLGMREIKVKGATGDENTNLKGKFQKAVQSLSKYNFCYLHIKAVDEFSHDGKFLEKKEFIEKIDKELKILKGLKNTIIILTADHTTPCKIGQHTPDPVPVFVYFSDKNFQNKIEKFSEKNCQRGKLGILKSNQFLKKILELSKNIDSLKFF